MSAEPERLVLVSIPDAEDRLIRISLLIWPKHPEFGVQAEIADYIPSRDLYGRGYSFDPEHTSKVIAALRGVKAGLQEFKAAGKTS